MIISIDEEKAVSKAGHAKSSEDNRYRRTTLEDDRKLFVTNHWPISY